MWDGIERRNRKKYVLIIDDDKSFLSTFKRICDAKSINCTATTKTTEFFNEFESGAYYVAFIDYKMALVDGVTLIGMLKRGKSIHTKVYILTGYDRENIQRKLEGCKVDGILSKEDGLAEILQKVLE